MKLLIDMNIPLVYSELFKERGIESLRWSEVGASDATDEEIMKYARDYDYIVLTCDLDFSAILSNTHEQKPSVAQIRASLVHAEQAVDMIITALKNNVDAMTDGAILSIDLKKSRLRLLPL